MLDWALQPNPIQSTNAAANNCFIKKYLLKIRKLSWGGFTVPEPLTRFFVYFYILYFRIKFKMMGVLKQVAEYLYIKKRDPNDKPTQWMKYMHGINRLSIILFLIALIIIAIKLIFR